MHGNTDTKKTIQCQKITRYTCILNIVIHYFQLVFNQLRLVSKSKLITIIGAGLYMPDAEALPATQPTAIKALKNEETYSNWIKCIHALMPF